MWGRVTAVAQDALGRMDLHGWGDSSGGASCACLAHVVAVEPTR
jgi:hypothetical protein